jgi:hypothetical protein
MKEKIWKKGIVTLPGDNESIRIKPYFSVTVSNINPIHRSLTVQTDNEDGFSPRNVVLYSLFTFIFITY